MRHKRSLTIFITTLYAIATYQFVRYYVVSTNFYLKVGAYLNGHERLPFQERVLPVFLIRGILACHPFMVFFSHRKGAFSPPERGAFFIISLVGFTIAAIFCYKLYQAVSIHKTLPYFVFPVFLYTTMWSYTIHIDQNFSYPYDFLSLAFFTAGLYYIYIRKFIPLVLIMILGTLNRETTLFLIGIYLLDCATLSWANTNESFRERFDLSRVPWLRIAILCIVWAGIKVTLGHIYAHNDRSEDYLRLHDNLRDFRPKNWPGMLNITGYLLPVVFILRRYIQPVRFANYIYIVFPWFAIMLCTGLLIETRIYGELSPLVAVAFVVQTEYYIVHLANSHATATATATNGPINRLPLPSKTFRQTASK